MILSQYDDPEYAISLLGEGSAGYAYLVKDRVGQGDQLARAIREVATGGSMLDPSIVEALIHPVRSSELTSAEEDLLQLVAEGRPIKAIAAVREMTPAAASEEVERLFFRLAREASTGGEGRAKAPAAAPRRHHRARGAGRDPQPPASGRAGGKAPHRGTQRRRDRAAGGHRPHIGHPRLLVDRRTHRSDRAGRTAE